MTTILAIDPAAARPVSCTGWAYAGFSDTQPFRLLGGGAIKGGFNGFVDFLRLNRDSLSPDRLHPAFNVPRPDVIVCEKYIPYNRSSDPTPLMVEAIVRYLEPDVVMQPSSILSKGGLVPDERLKQLGLYSTEGHHRDRNSAVKHALYYVLAYLGHLPTLELLRSPEANSR